MTSREIIVDIVNTCVQIFSLNKYELCTTSRRRELQSHEFKHELRSIGLQELNLIV